MNFNLSLMRGIHVLSNILKIVKKTYSNFMYLILRIVYNIWCKAKVTRLN